MGAQRITNADTTLQEGDQSLGCSLTLDGMVRRARPLMALGLPGLEAALARRFRRTDAPVTGV